MVVNARLQFDLQHAFFDALLDKVSALISVNSLTQFHYHEFREQPQETQQPSQRVFYGGKFYKACDGTDALYEALLLNDKNEHWFTSLEEIQSHLNKHNMNATFIELAPNQTVIPSFQKTNMNLVTASLLLQWFNFGPFGFHIEWLKEMPNYNDSYITRALLYLDKSLSEKEWLLGYGLHSNLIPISGNQPAIQQIMDSLDICRPICILDAHLPIAYINDICADLVFNGLKKRGDSPYTDFAAFKNQLDEQGGLFDKQLLWLIDILPEEQLLLQVSHILSTIDDTLCKSEEAGFSSILVNDTHTFSRAIIDFYQDNLSPVKIESVEQATNKENYKVKMAPEYPIEPLSPFRELFSQMKAQKWDKEQITSMQAFSTEASGSEGDFQSYLVLNEDPLDACKEDLLSIQVLGKTDTIEGIS
ncbi:hypothetical protein C1E24_01395 [Pseudoalteromonas phenolica]|uniref:Uncharacterized protein n=1 Tax=Pseudoalteromonas phenolica TaxID=161398 RepID=A0A5R9Q8G8_9GAMM|nr:hypothetical protein [Pseudoalteromonas phenolica]TLX48787.1 hypothetical protein C1E24_01395 [Pseudoalteromonas phenolica]